MPTDPRPLSRRALLRAGVSLPLALRLGAAGAFTLALTPERADAADADETPAVMEGPYFKAKSPERSVIREKDTKGMPLVVTGRVLSTKGVGVEKALIDVWQADGDGHYDLETFRLRGHQYTAADGGYRLDTVVAGYYPGRTRHIHVKVQAPGQPILTTQLFFPNDPGNRADGLYSSWLRMKTWEVDGGLAASFSFVVRTA